MRGMNHAQRDRAQQARRSRRRPPHRETLHVDKVREGSAALAGKRLGGFEARVTLPGSQQRLPRAGKWNSCGRGTPYGVTYTHFAIVSRSAASKCQ